MRRRAYRDRMRREEAHLIGIRNEIRSALGSDDLIEPDDLYAAPASGQDEEEELQAFKYRMREAGVVDWEEDLTT